MAIDPSISLDVRPPVIPQIPIQTPLEQFAKVLSLRNLMTEGESGQLELQMKQLQLDQAQQLMRERKSLGDLFGRPPSPPPAASLITPPAAPPSPEPNLMAPPAARAQVSPDLIPGLITPIAPPPSAAQSPELIPGLITPPPAAPPPAP